MRTSCDALGRLPSHPSTSRRACSPKHRRLRPASCDLAASVCRRCRLTALGRRSWDLLLPSDCGHANAVALRRLHFHGWTWSDPVALSVRCVSILLGGSAICFLRSFTLSVTLPEAGHRRTTPQTPPATALDERGVRSAALIQAGHLEPKILGSRGDRLRPVGAAPRVRRHDR